MYEMDPSGGRCLDIALFEITSDAKLPSSSQDRPASIRIYGSSYTVPRMSESTFPREAACNFVARGCRVKRVVSAARTQGVCRSCQF